MAFDARIDQLEGRSPESCLSWDVQNMIYFRKNIVDVQDYELFIY